MSDADQIFLAIQRYADQRLDPIEGTLNRINEQIAKSNRNSRDVGGKQPEKGEDGRDT